MSKNNALWWIALAIWMAGSAWWHTCRIKQLCDAPLVSAGIPSEETNISPLHIMDGSNLSLTAPGNFGFAKSGSEANFSAVRAELDSLKNYLKANPGKTVTITGYYAASETNNTTWPDLGIARAEGIKAYYVAQGLPASVFATKSALQNDIRFSPDSMKGGIDFAFSEVAPTTENKLAEAQKYSTIFKPLDLYFNTGSSDYIKTADNQKFVEEASRYLSANKDKKLLLTGHTDNVGKPASNAALSRKRAEQVRNQLVQAGLPAAQLVTDAEGQNSPKESNNTAEGRAANRRVAIVVQ